MVIKKGTYSGIYFLKGIKITDHSSVIHYFRILVILLLLLMLTGCGPEIVIVKPYNDLGMANDEE